MIRSTFGTALCVVLTGCFGARSLPTSYFTIHGEYVSRPENAPSISGFCRVQTLDAESVYQKFQIVVRRSPYELTYSDQNVWAVKPSEQVTDLVTRALSDAKIFEAISTELGDSRPTYSLAGKLHALELYDSGDIWFAHLSLSLRLVRFSDGERMWSMDYVFRKPVEPLNYGQGVRALSEMLADAISLAAKELAEKARDLPNVAVAPDPEPARVEPPVRKEPIFVPENQERRVAPDDTTDP